MLSPDSAPRNKILVVGRRGVGKLSLVQSILGSRFVPTTSVSKSRPSSPLILPAIPVPTLEETILEEHGILSHITADPSTSTLGAMTTAEINTSAAGAPPNNLGDSESVFSVPSTQLGHTSASQDQQQQQQQQQQLQQHQRFTSGSSSSVGWVAGSQSTQSRPKLDHSGVTIPWTIDTKYYSVQVDFWIDETEAQGRAELERMIEAGELDEMGSVIEAIVFCFSKNQVGAPMDQDAAQVGPIDGEVIEDYDDWCLGNGFEYIDLQDQSNDATEDEHVGLDRIMEALAAHMWDGLKRKSSKKRDQHDRSMMLSFQDDDIDMADDSSWRANASRRSFPGLDIIDEMIDADEDDDADDDEDEDDDRAFYKALAELNLHNRSMSPTAPAHGPRALALSQAMRNGILSNGVVGQESVDNDMTSTMTSAGGSGAGDSSLGSGNGRTTDGFDDDFDLDEQAIKALEGDDLEFWSSQETSRSDHRMDSSIDRTLARQFKQFLGQSLDDSATTSSETGGKEMSSGDLDDFSFDLTEEGGEFEFGNYVVSPGPGGEYLQDFDFNIDLDDISTPNQESIRTMHKALFSNIDGDDGMSQTLSTLQNLREQGKTMSENDRRELAARVALSFGMQLGE
ncbi:hypothetical protein BGZ99_006409 [Dissophora globulifera]|uniref:Increased recombination centers protein 6 n=1 Tax=Dissophora globulifera TaxID=979702 RepID=A0A9P6US71_9FUNG|nr:hypothetical protein BGZ99_006409 [Dissophora globulifera]